VHGAREAGRGVRRKDGGAQGIRLTVLAAAAVEDQHDVALPAQSGGQRDLLRVTVTVRVRVGVRVRVRVRVRIRVAA